MTKTQTNNDAADSSTASATGLKRKRVGEEDGLDEASKRLRTTLDDFIRDHTAHISKLQHKETQLRDRLNNLNERKQNLAAAHGNVNASDDDLIEINAGGKVITVKRGTLTQLHGSRLAALFSGRWDRKLVRDSSGHIFLDINGKCFRAIVDYLNELAISFEDEPPEPPTVDDELKHILAHQMKIFGLNVDPPIDSTILTQRSHQDILQVWLKGDGSDVELELLYRSSRDGLSPQNFHSECDNEGATVVIIETTDGGVVGGYTNTPWRSSGGHTGADKAFLFAMSGFGLSSPCKMKLRNTSDQSAIYNSASYGPSFGSGDDLEVGETKLFANIGSSFEQGPTEQLNNGKFYTIKEMEVFRVTSNPDPIQDPRKTVQKVAPVNAFTKEINDAINENWSKLHTFEMGVLSHEESFKDEEKFIESIASGDTDDIVMLNVSGTIMSTSRATLLLCEDSVLAQQFDDSKWTAQGCTSLARVKDWSSEEVVKWAKNIKNMQEEVSNLFGEHNVNGAELLALNEYGLEKIGVQRAGTICLLIKEIKQLEEASQDTATLIEYSPYCFGKILDYLRLKHLHALGLVDEPALPTVCESQKKRFEKVVKYYFPGECSKVILG